MLRVSVCAAALFAAATAQHQQKVVYGEDNRRDVYDADDQNMVRWAKEATVALMRGSTVDDSNPNNVKIRSSTLGRGRGLCQGERFFDDPIGSFCSGTLIDDDLVLTAGHCIDDEADCRQTKFVFNFYKTGPGRLQTITRDDVYQCTSIVARENGRVGGKSLDYAVLRIDRSAAGSHTPAPVRTRAEALQRGARVGVIGTGSGIPFKIDSSGTVRDPASSSMDKFTTNTDTFGGNSGSGTYALDTHEVVGILVSGETDYEDRGGCKVPKQCSQDGCSGERVTYVFNAIEAVCSKGGSQRLCNGGAPRPPSPPSPSRPNPPPSPPTPSRPNPPPSPPSPSRPSPSSRSRPGRPRTWSRRSRPSRPSPRSRPSSPPSSPPSSSSSSGGCPSDRPYYLGSCPGRCFASVQEAVNASC